MAAEAQALLRVAASQDPKEAASADMTGLMAIAGILSGRLDEANGIDHAALTGTDDITFWRAVRQAMRHQAA